MERIRLNKIIIYKKQMSGEIDTKKLMLDIIEKLNKASDYYYNGKEEIMSNYEWDNLFDKLRQLEKSSGITLPNSPTAKVSSDSIVGKKEKHEFPTLSLAKTKKNIRPRKMG